jgi:hypothetical protein
MAPRHPYFHTHILYLRMVQEPADMKSAKQTSGPVASFLVLCIQYLSEL